MCGILGSTSSAVSLEQFQSAQQKIAHRGPNDTGYFSDPKNNVQLGHQRLSILDLSSAGHQPMTSADNRFVITFNGEIYNYIELKEELSSHYVFQTKTDTEVLLAAYQVWGKECLSKLNGMFAFAIYHTTTGEVFCARDRVGEKPFFYSQTPDGLVFASEIKSLLALGVPARPNDAIVYDYLAFGHYDHTDETFFQGIKKLPAGCSLTSTKGDGVVIERYWDLTAPTIDYATFSYEELCEQFRTLLEDSVRLRFRSDVPVGINLSSGVDSTALLFFSEKVTGSHLNLFSMCQKDETFNECSLIDPILSLEQKQKWHTSTLSPEEVWNRAVLMNRIQDQPYGGIPTIAYGKLIEEIDQQKVTVVLEGQGVDEIFAGYKYYTLENKETTSTSQDATSQLSPQALAPEFVHTYAHRTGKFSQKFSNPLLNAQYRDIMHTKLPRVLRFNDHATMSRGKELRLPYLDHRLIEFAFFLPDEYKISPDKQKRLFRDALSGLTPPSTNQREKKSFGALQTPMFRSVLKEKIQERLSSPLFTHLPYFDQSQVQEQAERFFAGEGQNSFFLWQWLNLSLWFEEYIH